MRKQNNNRTTNFWFGFSLGLTTAVSIIYLFGTKKGRESLKKLIEFSENLEENLSQLLDNLDKNNHPLPDIDKKNLISIGNIQRIVEKIKNSVAKKG